MLSLTPRIFDAKTILIRSRISEKPKWTLYYIRYERMCDCVKNNGKNKGWDSRYLALNKLLTVTDPKCLPDVTQCVNYLRAPLFIHM